MNKQESGKRKRDALLLIFLLAGAAAIFIILFAVRGCGSGRKAVIKVDGNIIRECDINRDETIEVSGYNGGHNIVVIKDGQVSVTDADCPDKVCVDTGKINAPGQTIVCLPHRVVVEVK